MKDILFTIIVSILFTCFYAQTTNTHLEKKIKRENFKAVERIIKKEIRKNKKGKLVENGSGSTYISHNQTIEDLVLWLKKHKGVEDVFSDKCQNKIDIYPGWSVIGVKYKNKKNDVCYHIQLGKLGNLNIGKKIHFHLFKSRNVLKYIKSYEQEDFIEQEKINCIKEY